MYDIHGKLVRNFLVLDAITTVHVIECHFWGNGVVVLTSDMQLFVVEASISVPSKFYPFYDTCRGWPALRAKQVVESTLYDLVCDLKAPIRLWRSCHHCYLARVFLR